MCKSKTEVGRTRNAILYCFGSKRSGISLNWIPSVALLVMVAASIAAGQTRVKNAASLNQQAEQEVRKAEAERVQALLNQDWPTLERIYADDYLALTAAVVPSAIRPA